MHFHWISWKSKGFIFYIHNHVISLNSIHTTPKMVHAYTFGPKPHLLTKYHNTYIIHGIWPLLVFDLHECHSHPKLASAALPTKFGSIDYHILTSDDLWPPWRSSSFLTCISNSFWPNMVAMAHMLPYLTSDDLWPP